MSPGGTSPRLSRDPAKDSLGRRERGKLARHSPTERLSLFSEKPALRLGEPGGGGLRRDRSTRFSARKKSFASPCRRLIQLVSSRTMNWGGDEGVTADER
jgi:hypothetical protein